MPFSGQHVLQKSIPAAFQPSLSSLVRGFAISVAIIVALLMPAVSSAQEARLVFNTDWDLNGNAFVEDFVSVGDLSYLFVNDSTHGREIWRTDGTAGGSFLLGDLCPGPCHSRNFEPSASSVVELNGELLFKVSSAISQGLWKSDGTTPPVRLLNGRIASLVPLEHRVLVSRFNASNQLTLWVSDGTRDGTREISFASPLRLTKVGDRAFFNTSPSRLWTTDGTTAGTYPVQELGASAEIQTLTALGERALVQVRDGFWIGDAGGAQVIFSLPNGETFEVFPELPTTSNLAFFTTFEQLTAETKLWRTDGTAAGTQALGSLCEERCILGGDVAWVTTPERLFMLIPRPDETWELWTSDGTAAGTVLLRTLQYVGTAFFDPFRLTVVGERIFYADYAPDQSEVELWTSDGAPAGTRSIASFSSSERLLDTLELIAGDDDLWLTFLVEPSRGEFETEIWRSNSSATGTMLLQRISGHLERLVGFARGQLYFSFNDGVHGLEPWVTDGGEVGARLLIDIAGQEGGLTNADLTATRRAVFFSVSRDFQPSLWQSDGTSAGTMATPALGGGSLRSVIPFGDRILVFTDDNDLWLSDGTEAGSVLLADQVQASGEWAVLGDVLFFLERFDADTTLWRSDGTPAGTQPIATFSGPRDFYTRGLYVAGNTLIFEALSDEGPGLVRSDGTVAGTRLLALPIKPVQLMPLGGKIYFTNIAAQTELWETDGSEAGTRRVFAFAEVLAGDVQSFMHNNAELFFVVRAGNGQISLWRSNGTRAGTHQVAGLPGRPRKSFHPDGFVALGDAVLFVLQDAGGIELWRADAGGAARVVDLCPGECGSHPQAARAIADRLYFAATDGASGLEPWSSDGTAAGTFRLADVNPGPQSSNPGGFAGYAGEIYFHALHQALGTELWAYDLLGACPQSDELACLNGGRFEVSVDWRSQHGDGGQGVGRQLPFSDESRLFWFFNPENVELVVKILDGRPINDAFWFFYGALSDVEYWIDIRDRLSGRRLTFHNPPGQICGASDIHAFPEVDTPLTAPRHFMGGVAAPEPVTAASTPRASGTCQSDATTLCLRDGRFRVEVAWRDRQTGELKPGQVLPGTSESGYFWFFNAQNLELIVKVLDGRSINGKFWVFYGALSDVESSVTVTDLITGASKVYENPNGEICGVGDTLAFDG